MPFFFVQICIQSAYKTTNEEIKVRLLEVNTTNNRLKNLLVKKRTGLKLKRLKKYTKFHSKGYNRPLPNSRLFRARANDGHTEHI
jgi:hypothetical protein